MLLAGWELSVSTSQRSLILIAGIAGPLLFGAITVLVATTRPGYSHINQFISELGETGADYAWVMNGFGFMLSGALILAFVLGSRKLVSGGPLNVLGSLCLAAFAVCLALAGLYSCDVGCSPAEPSPDQKLHDLVSVIAFPAFIVGVMAWGAMFLRHRGSRLFGAYSIASALVSTGVLVAMVQSEATRDGTGLLQRLFLAILFAWLIALSIRLQREQAGKARAWLAG